MPSLSIVVPTSRGGADLGACLDSLMAERYASLEIVVVDNATPEGALAAVPGGVRILSNDENLGFVGACNQGIAESTSDLILLLNDDTVVEQGALRALVEEFTGHPAWGACQAKLLLMDDPGLIDTAGSFLTATGFLVHRGAFEPDRFGASDEIFAAKGAALLVRRSALEDAGMLDPAFFAYFEETDLCWRLWLAGWEVGYVAGARVLHKLGSTAAGLSQPFVQFHSYKNRIRTLIKNLGGRRLAWMLPYHLALCVTLAFWYALRRHPAIGLAILRAIAWNARNIRGTLRERRRIQRSRRVSDRVLMRRIMWPTPARTLLFYARSP